MLATRPQAGPYFDRLAVKGSGTTRFGSLRSIESKAQKFMAVCTPAVEDNGERGRNRTFNQLIKSRLVRTPFQTNSLSNQSLSTTKPGRKHF